MHRQSAINPLFLLITSYDTPGEMFPAPLGRQMLAAFLRPIPCAHVGRQPSAISGVNLDLSVVINPFSLPPIGLKTKNGHVTQFWSIETWEQAFSEGCKCFKNFSFRSLDGVLCIGCWLCGSHPAPWDSLASESNTLNAGEQREGKTGAPEDARGLLTHQLPLCVWLQEIINSSM